MALSPVRNDHVKGLEMQPKDRESMAQTMKDIRKARLRRQVLADPTMAQKLVAVEASPVYNSRGELIQSVGTTS